MGALTVMTLGAPRVLHDGVTRSFSIRKVLALTLYLAVTGQPHSRAHLIALFWPDADETHGLLNLRQTLLRVRRVLGFDAETDTEIHLHTPGDLVRLDLGADGVVDVARLHAATLPETPPEQRMAALQSYEEAFLAHLMIEDAPDFMDWVAAQRVHWAGCFDLIAERQMRWHIDDGHADEASTLGQTWVRRRPDCELAYRLLATAQATAGDVAGARLTLATATRYWAELGLAVSPETATLRAHLASFPAVMLSSPTARVVRLPFVGREDAFAHLRRAYRHALDGTAGAVSVVGEAGLGKSRLVEAFARWAEVEGADVAIGHAHEQSGRLPYQPLMELLRQRMAREHAPDDLLDDGWLIELQRLVPELHDRYPDLPLPVDDAAAGTRLLEGIVQLGCALARRRPVLWLLEDLHWADTATRDGLLYLLKRWQQERVPALLICTLRAEEVASSPEVRSWAAAVEGTLTSATVSLTPFSGEETTRTIRALLAESASAEICAWLYEQTHGNPLYLEQVFQALEERGAVQWKGGKPHMAADVEVAALTGWLPETLRGLLLRRVRRLDLDAQQVLAAGAIVGTRFDETLLTQITGMDEEVVLAALETAEQRLLLRAEAGRYRFAHDKLAEAVYGDLTLARRRVFHRRTLRALDAAGNAPPAELARHALAAEEWVAAERYFEQADWAARGIGAHRDALRFGEQAVRLISTSPSQQALHHLGDDTVGDLYQRLGLSYMILGEQERARALYHALLTDAQAHGRRALEGRALSLLGRLALDVERDGAAAQQYLDHARQIAHEQGDLPGHTRVERMLSIAAEEQQDLEAAWTYATHAVHLARETHQSTLIAPCLSRLGNVATLRGQWDAACAYFEGALLTLASESREHAPSAETPAHVFVTPLPWATFRPQITALSHTQSTGGASDFARQWGANILMWMGMSRLHVGEGDTGRAALQMGWQIFTERNELRFHFHYLLHRMLGWTEAGEYERALHEVEQVTEAHSTAIDRLPNSSDAWPYCAQADVRLALLQPSEARAPLEQAAAFVATHPWWERLLPTTRWCTYYALSGDWAAACAAALEAHALREASASPLTWFDFSRQYETEALLRAGDRARAEADVQRLANHIDGSHHQRYRLVYLRMQALLDRHVGDHMASVAHLLEALDLTTRLGLPGEEWQIAMELAHSYARLFDAQHAEEARNRATCVVSTLAMRITDPTLRQRFQQAALLRPPALD